MDTTLHPTGPELATRNRRILAERLSWPYGAVEACEKIERSAPDWAVTWCTGGDMTWNQPGYYAQALEWKGSGRAPWVYGPTPGHLSAAISDREPVERWGLRPYKPLTQVMFGPKP